MQMKKINIIVLALVVMASLVCTSCPKNGEGGWTPIPGSDETVVKAYSFLKDELKKSKPEILLIKVEKAQSRVVQGVILKLTCKYSKGPGTEKNSLIAVIYADLKQKHTLNKLKLDQ